MRLKLLRTLIIVIIAANMALATRILPVPAPARDLSGDSLSALVQANQQHLSGLRTLCVLLYDTYHATRLITTPETVDFFAAEALTAHYFRQFARISDLQVTASEDLPAAVFTERPVLHTIDFQKDTGPRIAILRGPLSGAESETLVAFMEDGRVVFVPHEAAE